MSAGALTLASWLALRRVGLDGLCVLVLIAELAVGSEAILLPLPATGAILTVLVAAAVLVIRLAREFFPSGVPHLIPLWFVVAGAALFFEALLPALQYPPSLDVLKILTEGISAISVSAAVLFLIVAAMELPAQWLASRSGLVDGGRSYAALRCAALFVVTAAGSRLLADFLGEHFTLLLGGR